MTRTPEDAGVVRRSRRRWWLPFAVCSLAVLAALGWVSHMVVALETGEARARTEADRYLVVRLALWRMDSWLAPQLAPEAARPYAEYAAYYAQNLAIRNDDLTQVQQGEFLNPSALMNFQSDYFRLHFQVPEGGTVSSPQVPTGSLLEAAKQGQQVLEANILHNGAVLHEVDELIDFAQLRDKVVAVEERLERSLVEERAPLVASTTPGGRGKSSWQSYAQGLNSGDANRDQKRRRQEVTYGARNAQNSFVVPPPPEQPKVKVGPLVPIWVPDAKTPRDLLFVRRANVDGSEVLQGILADWEQLRTGLLAQIDDLFPDARLVPVSEAQIVDDDASHTLATLPVELEVPPPAFETAGSITPIQLGLVVTWLAVLAGLCAAAVTLNKSIAYGEKRSQFASVVTHELRTPLTTFKMYSEMLAEGMVTDADKRQEYLRTLHEESNRLGTVVENVLAYARIEQGRAKTRKARVELRALLDRAVPQLERRAADVGMELRVDVQGPENAAVNVDQAAVEQVLFNLVDNACKYGCSTERPWIDLTAKVHGGRFVVTLCDQGPGVARAARRTVFEPFERGGEAQDDAVPGVGIGLALSRGLARDLGGDLRLETRDGVGACFVLDLPA